MGAGDGELADFAKKFDDTLSKRVSQEKVPAQAPAKAEQRSGG
jgi:hypothetical protein